MKLIIFISALFMTFTGDKLDPGDKVFITFQATPGQENTEAGYATGILAEYIKNKSSLVLVDQAEKADYTFVLYCYAQGKANMGKIDIIKAGGGNTIFESKWTEGKAKMYYGYSGVRHAIGTIFNQQVLGKYPHIEADNKP